MTLERIQFVLKEAEQAFSDSRPQGTGYRPKDLRDYMARAIHAEIEKEAN